MKGIFLFFSVAVLSLVSVSNALSCKLVERINKCADPPLQVKDGTPWCSFRVCAPSYEPAHACPRDIFAATHKCETVTMERSVWKCADVEPPVEISLPLGCDEVGSKVPCVEKIKACDCVSETKDVTDYLPQIPYRPICPKDKKEETP